MKHKKWIAIIVTLVIIIPIIIHIIFKIEAPSDFFIAVWTGDGVLTFWGAIIAAISTIFVFSSTIKYNREKDIENRKYSVMPYLDSQYEQIYSLPKTTSDKILYVSVGNIIKSSTQIPYSYSEAYDDRLDTAKNIIKINYFQKDNLILQYTLSNAGAGSAVRINFMINKTLVIPQFSIPVNSEIVFILLLKKDILIDDKKTMLFEYTYSDQASIARYVQSETIELYQNEIGLSTIQNNNDLLSAPIEITKEPNNA